LTDIDTKLKAFIPDYIPAVGEVDAFLKMPRPDGQPEVLGLNILVNYIFIKG
jgi:intraflagellar transport protein 46